MESTINMSQLADIIIVMSFFTIGAVVISFSLAETITGIADLIREKRKKKRLQQTNEAEQKT